MLHQRSGQHRGIVIHALIEWHVIEKSTLLHAAKLSLENDMFSSVIQVPDLYESLCPCSDITGIVDKVQGTSVTWQAITAKSFYLCCAREQIRSSFAYCGKMHAHVQMSCCSVSVWSSCSICSFLILLAASWLKYQKRDSPLVLFERTHLPSYLWFNYWSSEIRVQHGDGVEIATWLVMF